MKIPQCAPGRFYGAHSAEMEEAIRKVFAGGWYILGNEVRAFEEEFAAWCGCAGAVGVANGTDALELALRALRLPEKSRVAVPALTASATGMAVLRAGLTPVLVDLDQYRTMSVVSLREAFRFFADIRAVVPVNLYGQMAALDEIIPAAAEYGAAVVEDCAQAHGAQLHGRRAGVFGVFGSFSFYPTKNLGAVGDGGLVTCADAACRSELEALRQYGWRERFDSSEFGLNSRLDELQAAILRVKLPHLDKDNEKRRFLAARYTAGLTGLPLELPLERPQSRMVFHQYVIGCECREELRKFLADRGIGTAVHYPKSLAEQQAFAAASRTELPETERLLPRILSLPMYPELTEEEADFVIEAIREFFGA